jgi:hypothetical protein
LWARFGECYAGTMKPSVIRQIKKELQSGSFMVHGREKLRLTTVDLARSLMELGDIRTSQAKYILWSIGLPLFIMFEDDANFATANAALQSFKAGTIDRYRTWISGLLEKYWYDPILADHLDVPVEDVIAQKIKIKTAWVDLVFEAYKEKIEALHILRVDGTYDDIDVLEALGDDKTLERHEQMARDQQAKRDDAMATAQENATAQGLTIPNVVDMAKAQQNGNDNPDQQTESSGNF